jgi:hypothetical protein
MDTQQNVEPNSGIRNVSGETDNQMNMGQSQNLIIGLLVILLVLSFLGINILLVVGNFFQALINIFGPLVYQILGVFGYTTGAVINKTADVVSDTTKVGIDIAEGTVQSVGNLLIKSSGAVVDPNAKRLLDNVVNTPIRLKMPTPPPVFVPVPVPVPVEVKVPVYSPGSSNNSVSFNSLLNNPITRFLMYDPSKTPAPTPTAAVPTTPVPMTPVPTTPVPMTPAPTTPAPTTAVPTETSAKIQNPISSNKISWCFAGEYQGKRGCVEVEDQSKCLSGQVFPSQQSCLSTVSSSDPLISKPIVPTMSSAVSSYGNGTMMMNGLPAPPTPPNRPTIEQLQTMNPSIVSQPAATSIQQQQNAPFLPYVPPQTNSSIITADGPPLVNGPINYFYTYSDKLGTEKNI